MQSSHIQVISLPEVTNKEKQPLTATCAGCVRIAKCADSDADVGCTRYRPLASSYARLPEAVYLTLINSRMKAGVAYPTDTLTALGNMFHRAAIIQRKLENMDYPLAVFTCYYLRITGVGAYLSNYRRVVLVDAFPRDGELFLVFIDYRLSRAFTVPAPRKMKFKRTVDSDVGQAIYSLDEWEEAKAFMIEAEQLVDPWLIENAKRAIVRRESDRMQALLGNVSNKKGADRDLELERVAGNVDEDLLTALVAERKSGDDYVGQSDALTPEELERQADDILAAGDRADSDADSDEEDEEDSEADDLKQLTDLFRG